MSSRSCEDEATVIPGEQPCICPPPCISTLTQYSPCPRCGHPHKSRGSIPSNEDADRKPAVLFGVSLDQNYSVQKENIGCLKNCRIFLFILSMLIIRLYYVFRHILETEGVQGLFRGLGPNLVGVAPSR